MIKLFKIKGHSLYPLYKQGQIVCAFNSKILKLKKDDVVVFTQKDHGLMIKKIKYIQIDEKQKSKYYMIGTNPDSIDSRNFGLIDENEISYKVLFTIF